MTGKRTSAVEGSSSERDNLRKKIDAIDDKTLELFNQRALLALEVGKVKKKAGEKLFDAERESAIYQRVIKNNTGPLSSEAVLRLFERIIDEIRRVERIEIYDKKGE